MATRSRRRAPRTLPRSTKAVRERVPDWRAETLSRLRDILQRSDPDAIEERKWRMPSKPDGVPVWSHNGLLCVADTLKRAVRLTFPKGAQIPDPTKLFNARLDSRSVRAVDFFEGEPIRSAALSRIVRKAAALNSAKAKRSTKG